MNPADFFRGIAYAFKGIRILRRDPGLARYWGVPIVLTLAALIASVLLAVRFHDDLLARLWSEPGAQGMWGGLLASLYWAARVLSFGFSLALFGLACIVLSMWLAAPFNDALSEAVEAREIGRPAPPFSFARLFADLFRTLRLEALKLTLLVSFMGPLLVLSWLVPGVGQVVYAIVGGLFTCAYFALDYIDWPASRRGLGVRARFGLLRRRPWLMLGFGMAAWACLFIPLLNVAFMPIAVAGGTRLFLDLEGEQHT